MRWIIITIASFSLFSEIAIAQEIAQVSDDLWREIISMIAKSLGVDNFIATYLIVMTVLRLIAEGGGYLASKTENKLDNKIVCLFGKLIKIVSKIVGYFGIGSPKLIKDSCKKSEVEK